jgi:hypothetical protein
MYQSVSMQLGFGMGGIMNERSIGLLAFPPQKTHRKKKFVC